jgi:arginyl-tRNA synthetase
LPIAAQLSFRVAGKLLARPVELGQRVKAGQVLAQLDAQDYKLGADAARAQLAAATTNRDLAAADLSLLDSKASDHLLRRLAEYPELLTDAAADLAPHVLAFYLRDLAGDFHTFYNADRVLVDDQHLKLARLALLSATRQVLQNGLKVLGVSAPAKM